MKPLFMLTVLAIVLLAASNVCQAMLDIEQVDKPRAKELGITIRVIAADKGAVRVVLEADAVGPLKSFKYVELSMRDGPKFTVSATLKNEATEPGHIYASCYIDRAMLDQLTLRVVAESGLQRDGYDLRIKDFAEAVKAK